MGEVGFGLLTTARAVGGLLGTLAYGWIKRRVSLGDMMRIGLVSRLHAPGARARHRALGGACAIFFVFGATRSSGAPRRSPSGSARCRPSCRAGSGSVNLVGVFGGLVVGPASAACIAQHWGLTAPFWFAFVGSAVFVRADLAPAHPHRPRRRGDPGHCLSGSMGGMDVSALISALPDGVVVSDPEAMEKYRFDWSRDASAGKPVAVVRARVRRTGAGRGPLGRRAPRARGAAGRGLRVVRGFVGRRRRDRGQPRADARHRDRHRVPGRRRRAGCVQRRGEGGRGRARAVVPARPLVVRDLLDRRQRGDQCRRPVLREVRRHHGLRAGPGCGPRRRDTGDAGREADQGRRRALVAQAVRRQ